MLSKYNTLTKILSCPQISGKVGWATETLLVPFGSTSSTLQDLAVDLLANMHIPFRGAAPKELWLSDLLMISPIRRRFLTILTLRCTATQAQAGRPMIVDDVGIVGANDCQLESWAYNNTSGTEYWVLPACNINGNLEIAVGAARMVGAHHNASVAVLQGKTLFKPLAGSGWGAGLVFGTQTVSGYGGFGDLFATVSVSFAYQNSAILVHINAGFVHARSSHCTHGTWVVGLEAALTGRATFTVETVGQQGGKPIVQVGTKYWLTKDRVQLDAKYGNRIGHCGSDRIFTLGVVLFTKFLQ